MMDHFDIPSLPTLKFQETGKQETTFLSGNVQDSGKIHTPDKTGLTESVKFLDADKVDICCNTVIDICEKHIFGQTASVQGIINICSQFSSFPESESFCNQIIAFCNQIISETLHSSHTIINICKSFSHLEVSNENLLFKSKKPSKEPALDKSVTIKIENPETKSKSEMTKPTKKSPLPNSNIASQIPKSFRTSPRDKVEKKYFDDEKDDSLDDDTDNFDVSRTSSNLDGSAAILDDTVSSNLEGSAAILYDTVSDDIDQEEFPDWAAHWEKKKKKDVNSTDEEIYEMMLDSKFREKKKKVKNNKKAPKNSSKVKEVYKCPLCSKEFTTTRGKEKHELFHQNGGKNRFKCDQCGYVFPSQSALENHLRTHTGERPFVCEVCGSAYAQMSTLKGHQLLHVDEKPESCELCGYRCKSKKLLKRHMIVHSDEKKFQCDECGARFARGCSLKKHLRTHTNDFPFSCPLCPKKFKCRVHLRRHEKVHDGSMDYSCKICGKRSRQKYNITVHMRTHNGEKPYECEVCGKRFAHNVTKRQHRANCFGKVEILLDPPLGL